MNEKKNRKKKERKRKRKKRKKRSKKKGKTISRPSERERGVMKCQNSKEGGVT